MLNAFAITFQPPLLLLLLTGFFCSAQLCLGQNPSRIGGGASSPARLIDFTVTATPSRLVTTPSTNISLVCSASARPILCLWKTPYGHIYTLSEGVFAESGRLRYLGGRSASQSCGLEIVGVEPRDEGAWECEVGAVIRDDFKTKTDRIFLDVKSKRWSFFFQNNLSEVQVVAITRY